MVKKTKFMEQVAQMSQDEAFDLMHKYTNRSTLIMIAAGMLAVTGFITNLFTTSDSFHLIMFLVMGLIFLGGVYKNKAKKIYANKVLEPEIAKRFPGAKFMLNASKHDEVIAPFYDAFSDLKLLKHDSTENISNVLLYTDADNPLCMFSLKCEHTTRDKNGSHTVVTYRGTEVCYEYDTGYTGCIRILCSHIAGIFKNKEKTFLDKKCQWTPEKIETGHSEFDQTFEVFASDQHSAFVVLTPFVIEKLLQFRTTYGDYALCVSDSVVYMVFPGLDKFICIPTNLKKDNTALFDVSAQQVDKFAHALNEVAVAISQSVKNEKVYK